MTLSEVDAISINYDNDDNRIITCFCGKKVLKTMLPHLKKEHPEKWEAWRKDFVRLRNKGWSHKRIMWKYRAIFSWSIIEREIRKMAEEERGTVSTQKKSDIKEWISESLPERTTVWNFEKRGNWAVHSGEYRGNWPPQVPRNLIAKYTREGDQILDLFTGGGTTLIEAYLLKRRSIGIDISQHAIRICRDKIAEMEDKIENRDLLSAMYRPRAVRGDATKAAKILKQLGYTEECFDLVCAHPPYMNSIIYTGSKVDLSNLGDVEQYCEKISQTAEQSFKLLKRGGICGILIGDVRKDSKLIPLGFKVADAFLNKGFTLKDLIVKIQHKDRSTEFYRSKNLPHYLLRHEYLLIFNK